MIAYVTAQPIGQPEICKISCRESSVEGGGELFIIGKNFMKGTKVFFQEREDDDEEGEITWQKEADVDKDYFQQVQCNVLKSWHKALLGKGDSKL